MKYELKIYDNEGIELYSTSTNDFDNLNADVRQFKKSHTYTKEHEKELSNLEF
jgi:hypothetical protein